MKTIKSLLALILFLLSLGTFAQTQTKIIAVVTKADWCPTCKLHGARVVTEVLPLYKAPDVKIMVNDRTNETTKASSNLNLKQEGIGKAIGKNPTTGEIIFINAITKKIISKISVAKSSTDIQQAFDLAISKS
ncbi:hypothetical protein [Flavobacterium sp.]|uniref:hypothetical protein n=1 Tax=Flavobacterium sp. TaxID=239 RepID=UPI003D117B3B